jgi:hypothetical protein
MYDPTQFFQELAQFNTTYKAAIIEILQINSLQDNIRAQVLTNKISSIIAL